MSPAYTIAFSYTVHDSSTAHSGVKTAFASTNKAHGAEEHMVPIEVFNSSVCQQKSPHIHSKIPRNWTLVFSC